MNVSEQLDDAVQHGDQLLADLIEVWQRDTDLTARVLGRIVGNPVLAGSCILTLINMTKELSSDERRDAQLAAHA